MIKLALNQGLHGSKQVVKRFETKAKREGVPKNVL